MLPWVVLGIVLAIGLLISILHTSITYYLDEQDRTILATLILIGGLIYLCKYILSSIEYTKIVVLVKTSFSTFHVRELLNNFCIKFFSGIYLYLWAVVFSHYLDVRDEEERGRYRKAPYKR